MSPTPTPNRLLLRHHTNADPDTNSDTNADTYIQLRLPTHPATNSDTTPTPHRTDSHPVANSHTYLPTPPVSTGFLRRRRGPRSSPARARTDHSSTCVVDITTRTHAVRKALHFVAGTYRLPPRDRESFQALINMMPY